MYRGQILCWLSFCTEVGYIFCLIYSDKRVLVVTLGFDSDHLAIRVAHPQPVIHPPQYPTMSTFKPGPCPTTPTVSSHAPSISSSHGGPTHSMSTASLHSTMAALSSIRELSPKWTATKALTIIQLGKQKQKIANLATIPPYPSAYNATLTTLEKSCDL